MNDKLHRIGRLGAVGLMALLLAGFATDVAASDNSTPRPDFGSRERFTSLCHEFGGTVVVVVVADKIQCHYPDGSVTECDGNGKNCTETSVLSRPLDSDRLQDPGYQTAKGVESGSVPSPAGQVEATGYYP